MPPVVLSSREEIAAWVRATRDAGRTFGLVPTMGALHAGHLSLVAASKKYCDVTAVTLFVNPTQFGPNEDFTRYPRTLESDLALLSQAGADVAVVPAVETIYPDPACTRVEVEGVALSWEGAFRPGHFGGVATVVLKLFQLLPADRAFFGQKDYQQTCVIRQMVRDLFVPIQLEVCPTVREPDGLAMSSRNRYLSASERDQALSLSRALRRCQELYAQGERQVAALQKAMYEELVRASVMLDYAVVVDASSLGTLTRLDRPAVALIAGKVGSTRLIDNCLLGE